jgi:ABC-type branched-subunit amino acid transport system substrate-binding protein
MTYPRRRQYRVHSTPRRQKSFYAAAVLTAVALALAACSSSSSSSTTTTPASGSSGTALTGSPIKLGIIASLTGFTSFLANGAKAFEARLALQNSMGGIDGHPLEAFVGDDTSTPAGALTAVRNLVENDNVLAIGDSSIWIYGAAQYLKANNIPVTGWGTDGPQWGGPPYTNFFAVEGSYNPKTPATTTKMAFMKQQGCTSMALLGLGGTPSALDGLKALAYAAKYVGMKVGYFNGSIPFTTTDYTSIVLGIKDSGADCIQTNFTLQGTIALAEQVKQAGVPIKHILNIVGYGEPSLLTDAGGLAALNGDYFDIRFTPFELHTPATEAFAAALQKYEGITGDVDAEVTSGWLAADLLIQGLKIAGPNATRSQLISAISGITDYTGTGLETEPINFKTIAGTQDGSLGPGYCTWFTELQGSTFSVVGGPKPFCGTVIPNSDQA